MVSDTVSSDPRSLMALAVAAAVRAGHLVRAGQSGAAATATTKSSPTDAVTAMDRAAEEAIVEVLLAARPRDGIVGEEGGERGGQSSVRWHVDPIDGTVNYMYGLPQYAVCIGAEVAGEVVAGAVFAPALGALYSAVQGGGAWRNGVALHCSEQDDLALSLVATGFGYGARLRAFQGTVAARMLPLLRDIRRFGSAALDLCAVAEGTVDGYYEQGLHSWDLAAAGLVAEEAGARVSKLAAPHGGDAVVAAGSRLHGALEEQLREAFGG